MLSITIRDLRYWEYQITLPSFRFRL